MQDFIKVSITAYSSSNLRVGIANSTLGKASWVLGCNEAFCSLPQQPLLSRAALWLVLY